MRCGCDETRRRADLRSARADASYVARSLFTRGAVMKTAVIAALATVLLAPPGMAQTVAPTKGDVTIGSERPPLTVHQYQRCVDVEIGGDQSISCLNEQLKRQVDQVNPAPGNIPPLDAKSQDLKVGVVNTSAVKQQYGKNYGISAFPFRPPPLVYSTPMGPRR